MRRRPGVTAFIVSLAVHGVLLVPFVVFARPPEPIEFETIKLNLVSPPPTDVVQPEPEPARQEPQPEPEPVQVEPEPEPESEVREEPEREPPEEQPETEKPPETPEPRPERETSDRDEAAGGDDLNIATEGREFPYPDYLANVIVQVKRYFRWNDPSHPQGVIYFEILPEGGVRNIRMVRSSGNIRFDFAVQGAVEQAGTRGAFGPLPEGYAGSFLPVQMEVEPPR